MRDLHFTVSQQKRELSWLLSSLLIALLLNLFSIIYFDTKWIELFTQMGWVIILGIIIYLAILVVRILIFLIRKLIRR